MNLTPFYDTNHACGAFEVDTLLVHRGSRSPCAGAGLICALSYKGKHLANSNLRAAIAVKSLAGAEFGESDCDENRHKGYEWIDLLRCHRIFLQHLSARLVSDVARGVLHRSIGATRDER